MDHGPHDDYPVQKENEIAEEYEELEDNEDGDLFNYQPSQQIENVYTAQHVNHYVESLTEPNMNFAKKGEPGQAYEDQPTADNQAVGAEQQLNQPDGEMFANFYGEEEEGDFEEVTVGEQHQ